MLQTYVSVLSAGDDLLAVPHTQMWLDGYRPDGLTWVFSTTGATLDVTAVDWNGRGSTGNVGDCLAMAVGGAIGVGEVFDYPCDYRRAYMCEYEL